MKVTNKRGAMTLSDLAPAAIAFVFIAVVISVGSEVLGGIQEDQLQTDCTNSSDPTTCGAAYNATQQGLEAQAELSSWLPLIALVIAAAVVIGVLSFFRR